MAIQTELDHALSRAEKWIMYSGIVHRDGKRDLFGSVNAWFEEDAGIYPFIYSEITGYYTTLMCWLWDNDEREECLEIAKAAGLWLLHTMYEPNGGFRTLYPLISSKFDAKKDQIYAFDVGIVLNGLVELYRATEEPQFLAAAVTAGDWLINQAQKPDGSFFPIYQIDEERFFESDKEWSTTSGSYHSKIAIGLLNLFDLTQRTKYQDAAVKVCDVSLGHQDGNGRFVSFQNKGGTNAHSHCYSCEGLWSAGIYLNRENYLEKSAQGIKWLLDMQSEEGYIPRLFHDDQPIYHERVDAMSQTLRLAVLHLAQGTLTENYREKAQRLVSIILRNQANTDDIRTNGGFYFGRSSSGAVIRHVNSWVTAFAMQSLQLYRESLHVKPRLKPFHIV